MAESNIGDFINVSGAPKAAARKKTPEACERCREKRIKCNGLHPCDQCVKKDIECIFASAPAVPRNKSDAVVEKLDIVLSRLDKIEQQMGRQAGVVVVNNNSGQASNKQPQHLLDRRSNGVVQLNQATGCFEYYGQTSTFMIASSLGKRLRQLEDASAIQPSVRQRRHESGVQTPISHEEGSRSLDLNELTGFCDYVVPLNELRSDRFLREGVADRHLDSFFETIHIFLPILDPVAFRSRYHSLRPLFGDRRLVSSVRDDPRRPQFVCLLYAVLALGALYDDEREDGSSWAPWYFAEAQDMLGRLLSANNFQLVQAATLMGAYAQHAIKPNLAYILSGTAIRLAFSVGLNVESTHRSLGIDVEEAKRTWWIIYIQEVELSLDAGRPMSLRTSDMTLSYPKAQQESSDSGRLKSSPITFIRYLAEIAQIMQNIINLSSEAVGSSDQITLGLEQREALRLELDRWQMSLPGELGFRDHPRNDASTAVPFPLTDWKSRQHSSLRIHYNLAIITLFQGYMQKKSFELWTSNSQELFLLHRSLCLDAARDMIRHIYELFTLAPRIRRWSYYCFYCLQSVLVLLPQVAYDEHSRQRRQRLETNSLPNPRWESSETDKDTMQEDLRLCHLAIEIFKMIRLKASQQCADVVCQFLNKWLPRSMADTHTHQTNTDGAQRPTPPTSTTTTTLDHSTGPSVQIDHPMDPMIEKNLGSTTSEAPFGSNQKVGEHTYSVEEGSSVSPDVSVNGLQAALYDALYSNNPSDCFRFNPQMDPLGGGNSNNNAPCLNIDEIWDILHTDDSYQSLGL